MARKARARVIDFEKVFTPREEAQIEERFNETVAKMREWGVNVHFNTLPGLQESYPERPQADLSGIKPIVLEHLRDLAMRLRKQEGYWSQFVALSKAYHTHLGADVDGVLKELWHEAWRQKGKAVTPAKKGEDPEAGGDRKTSWTLDELWDTEFPDLQFLVDTLIPEGLSLLVAAPKVGKSYWLATLIVCLLGDVAPFGKEGLKPRGCDVLLITPDDPSARRLQKRITSIAEDLGLNRGDLKYNLVIEEEWAPIEDGGAEDLDAWLIEHPNTKAVFIDTLDRLRSGGNGSNWMKADEHAMAALKAVADARGVTIVGTHHDRKNKDTDDVLDVVSGGRKITGGVDAILVVTRARNSPYAKLQLIGRDVEDVEYHMAFDYPVWTLGDKVQDGDATPTQRTRKDEVLDVLREDGQAMTAEAVHKALAKAGTSMTLDNVRKVLTRLKEDGKAVRIPRVDGRKGGYRAAL